ncbi:MAG: N-acetyl-gamma-glutamyl-phosphate reductase [Verrucomicrobia bacterium TMED44]|nr:MAG: N-acetyl-gamma-glutamyl-phosphate reductase [Verrucomicrobia bacterium TMED44]
MKACIIGASGYTGRELVKLLLKHPKIELTVVTSRSLAGQKLDQIIPQVADHSNDLVFSNPGIEDLSNREELEIFFLALPHGTAATYAVPLLEAGKKVIDLSADFRLRSSATYQEFYGEEHPAQSLLKTAQYGLPELHQLSWEKSNLIASPGCYPTSILIPLAPLVHAGNLVQLQDIVINSMSGISGAGRNASEKLLYCERNENASAYGLPKHRHLSEIEEQLSSFAEKSVVISFHPHLAPMNRGICTTISVKATDNSALSAIYDVWKQTFMDRPFARILETGSFPEVSHVVGSNRVDFSAHFDSRSQRYIICSAEDNLIKGAGGQAIQSMNICEGFDETTGLL